MRAGALALSLLLVLPALHGASPEGRLTLEAMFHPTKKVDFAGPAGPRYSWLGDGGLLESRMEKGYSSMFVISYDEGTRPDLADAVLDGPRSVVVRGAYNRMPAQMAVLHRLLAS